MYKNLYVIQKRLMFRAVLIWLVFSAFCFYFERYTWIYSSALGTLFSALAFRQLLVSQTRILKMKKKDLFFLAYLSRLGFYGVPVFLSFYFAAYFNSLLVIMCLFSFHLLYIILELKKNLKRYKARKTSG